MVLSCLGVNLEELVGLIEDDQDAVFWTSAAMREQLFPMCASLHPEDRRGHGGTIDSDMANADCTVLFEIVDNKLKFINLYQIVIYV
jgi:hypothetical protein